MSKISAFFLISILFLSFSLFNFYHKDSCPNFDEKTISINGKKMEVLLAKTDCQRELGLMNQQNVPKDGMIFSFPKSKILSFWMKNTLIPLSIAYVTEEGIILDILDMYPQKVQYDHEYKIYSSRYPVKFALEVELGYFSRENIKVGDKIKLEGEL